MGRNAYLLVLPWRRAGLLMRSPVWHRLTPAQRRAAAARFLVFGRGEKEEAHDDA